MRAHVVGLGLSAAQLTSAAALAQSVPTPETTPPASTVAPPPALTSNPERDGSKTSYWASGTTRPFLSTSIDVGYLYLRPRVSLGYGTPFSKWIGIDLNPAAGIRFLGGYAGFRASLPRIDLRVGARYTWAFQQHFLAPNLNFHRLDIESQALERSQYTTLEAELTGNLPAGPGTFLGIALPVAPASHR